MSKKEDRKDEVTIEALQKTLQEQDGKILTLLKETERVRRNSRIIFTSFIIMVIIVAAVVSATVFWKPTSTWHEVSRFSGAFKEFEINDTDAFTIPSDRWRIYWYVKSDYNGSLHSPPEDVEFRLFLADASIPPIYTIKDSMGLTIEERAGEVAWLKRADFSGSIGMGPPFDEWILERSGVKYITGSGTFSFHILGASLKWEIVVEAYY